MPNEKDDPPEHHQPEIDNRAYQAIIPTSEPCPRKYEHRWIDGFSVSQNADMHSGQYDQK
jgi:hypothetical protein